MYPHKTYPRSPRQGMSQQKNPKSPMCFLLKFFSSRKKVRVYQFLRPPKKRTLPRSNPIANKTNGTRTITSWFWRWNHVFCTQKQNQKASFVHPKRSQKPSPSIGVTTSGIRRTDLTELAKNQSPNGSDDSHRPTWSHSLGFQWFLKETVQWWWDTGTKSEEVTSVEFCSL